MLNYCYSVEWDKFLKLCCNSITLKKIPIVVIICLLPAYFAKGDDSIASVINKTEHIVPSHDDIKLGERLFHGLIKTGENTVSCKSCHYFFQGDTVNWNPSAYEIAHKVAGEGFDAFKNALLNPSGKKISEVHNNFTLTDKQVQLLRDYLVELSLKGETPSKPIINNLLLVIGLIVLMIFSIIDLIYKKIIRLKIIHFIIILASGIILTKIGVTEAIAIGRSQNYEPDQPIKFSHAVHVTQNKIDCEYCHSTVEYSKTAGIPSVNVCMNCHVLVREGSRSGKFEISKVINAFENKKNIKWIKIHNLPDYVFFSHAQHVGAGKLECQTCHGPVEQMNRVKQVSDLSMGWCVNCHRETKVQFTDNAFYDKYEELHKQIKEGKIDKVTVDKIGGLDCMKCHY